MNYSLLMSKKRGAPRKYAKIQIIACTSQGHDYINLIGSIKSLYNESTIFYWVKHDNLFIPIKRKSYN